jgi:hypothetical protein
MHTMPDQQSASPNAEGEQPDTLVTDKAICEEFAITPMSLWRWDRDERLGFPPPIRINSRKYRSRRQIEEFKARLIRGALKSRAASRTVDAE